MHLAACQALQRDLESAISFQHRFRVFAWQDLLPRLLVCFVGCSVEAAAPLFKGATYCDFRLAIGLPLAVTPQRPQRPHICLLSGRGRNKVGCALSIHKAESLGKRRCDGNVSNHHFVSSTSAHAMSNVVPTTRPDGRTKSRLGQIC